MTNFKRNQEVAAEQETQKTRNAAKTLAYSMGLYDGGWLVEAAGHIDGFSNDYSFVHSNPGNIACHRILAVRDVEGMDKTGLDELLSDCLCETGEQPEVTLITDDELAGCKARLRTAYDHYFYENEQKEATSKPLYQWLDELLEDALDETSVNDTETLAGELS